VKHATRRTFALATLSLAGLAACSGDDPLGPESIEEVVGLEYGGGTFLQTLESGGLARSYTVVVPAVASAATPAPLLLVYHDTDQDVESMRALSDFDEAVASLGWIVAYLAADQGSWAITDRVPPGSSGIDDVAFSGTVVDRIGGDLAIDPNRIHAVGFGEGGLMAQAVVCGLSGRVGSVAAIGTSTSREVAVDCVFDDNVAALMLAGTDDPVHRYSGGSPQGTYGLLSANGALLWWAGQQGCGPVTEVTVLPDSAADGTTVERFRFPVCSGGVEVRLYTVFGGGHTWPGSVVDLPAALGPKSLDLDATELVLEFFQSNARE
jgi:polyhydroxybutyrate depolymerase